MVSRPQLQPFDNDSRIITLLNQMPLYIKRAGKAVTILSLVYFEPNTAFRGLNDFLFLMCQPTPDKFFKNPSMGKLKDVLIFVVDNAPSVAPSNTLVQMFLVRLRQLLNIDKVVQKSFAEYNSKRNFVERVHAVENEALYKHGRFDSHQIHQTGKTGSLVHKQNITAMAEIQTCLNSGVLYHGKPLEAFRATCDSNFVFDDEKELKNFLSLSESQEAEFSDS